MFINSGEVICLSGQCLFSTGCVFLNLLTKYYGIFGGKRLVVFFTNERVSGSILSCVTGQDTVPTWPLSNHIFSFDVLAKERRWCEWGVNETIFVKDIGLP